MVSILLCVLLAFLQGLLTLGQGISLPSLFAWFPHRQNLHRPRLLNGNQHTRASHFPFNDPLPRVGSHDSAGKVGIARAAQPQNYFQAWLCLLWLLGWLRWLSHHHLRSLANVHRGKYGGPIAIFFFWFAVCFDALAFLLFEIVLLCKSGWPQTCHPPVPASQGLKWQVGFRSPWLVHQLCLSDDRMASVRLASRGWVPEAGYSSYVFTGLSCFLVSKYAYVPDSAPKYVLLCRTFLCVFSFPGSILHQDAIILDGNLTQSFDWHIQCPPKLDTSEQIKFPVPSSPCQWMTTQFTPLLQPKPGVHQDWISQEQLCLSKSLL